VVDELKFDKPKTGDFASVLRNLKIERSCLVTISSIDVNLYKSARNIPKVIIMPVAELNAGDICNHRKMLITHEAFLSLLNKDKASEN
jgi:large subunit ribosomal protein L4